MNPLSIHKLLARYASTLRAPQGIVRDSVVRAYMALGVPCTEKDVSYTPTTRLVTITASGPKRIEMLMRKGQVLTQLQTELRTADMPKDIV